MPSIGIKLNDVNLFYSSKAYQDMSLKSVVCSLVKNDKKIIKIHDIHALKDVSLEINAGERVALLGHNGAGKSTFLKMLAGLYPIRSGTRYVKGQIRSIFELNLGFESEVSGRENILYRGLLLGLSPKVVYSEMESIIEFADIGEFIDYPIKTYSSGMLVRLAFAITTSLTGQVLLLDEVMGVGDASFIEKAKVRLNTLIAEAEIIIFATHDIGAAREICTRGLVFKKGSVIFDGTIDEAVEMHLKTIGA